MMAQEALATAAAATMDSAGMYEPPIIGEMCAPAFAATMVALRAGLPDSPLCERVTAALERHKHACLLAGAESCERNSLTPQAVFNRWLARVAGDAPDGEGAPDIDYEDAEPFFELYAVLLSRMWGWLTRRRMLAEMQAEQAARPPERLRWEDAEPIVRAALGAAYQPPDTPEKREALRRWAELVKRRGGTPNKAQRKWLDAWRRAPARRNELIKKALAWK